MDGADHRGAPLGDGNPLLSPAPEVWDRLIEVINPASLLVVIEARLSGALKRRLAPEDIWQDALLHVWRDRHQCQWRGIRSFRAWVLTIIENRIREAAAREQAEKRGGGNHPLPFSAVADPSDTTAGFAGPAGSTTPSRVAIYQEQAAVMKAALASLPEDVREIVRLRLLEQLTIDAIADRLGLGESAVRHRFRKGAELYQRRLLTEFATRSTEDAD